MPYDNVPESKWDDMDSCVKQAIENDSSLSKESAIAICYTSIMGESAKPETKPHYKRLGDANKSILSIRPRVTLEQANEIASLADSVVGENESGTAWPVAIAQWKKGYMVRGGKWISRKLSKNDDEEKEIISSVKAKEAETIMLPSLNEITVATSFADMRAQQEASDAFDTSSELINQFQGLAMNIVSLPGTGKVAKLRALVDEFVVLVADALGELEPEQPQLPAPAPAMEMAESGARMRGEMLARLADARKTLDEIHEWGSYAERRAEQSRPAEAAQKQPAEQLEVFAESIDASYTNISDNSPDITTMEVLLSEAKIEPGENRRAPIKLDIVGIVPGWGNKKDMHYYPKDVLVRDAGIFVGAKMYPTDHRQGEKNVMTEVSVIDKLKGFRDDGAPIYEVTAFQPDFCEMVRNRAEAGKLHTLECSILAGGRAREGVVDGVKGKIVEAFTERRGIDWVTRAGAGGHADKLAESESGTGGQMSEKVELSEQDEGQPEKYMLEVSVVGDGSVSPSGGEYAAGESVSLEASPADGAMFEGWSGDLSGTDNPQSLTMDGNKSVTATFKMKESPAEEPAAASEAAVLSEAERDASLEKTSLPGWAKDWLREASYSSEAELAEAIKRATERIKKVTRSGQPFAQGSEAAPVNVSLEENETRRKEKFNEIMRRTGMKEV